MINILRIVFFSISSKEVFDTLHLFTWYILSIIIVVGTWFLTVKLFKIKSIPVYDDFKFFLKQTKKTKRTKKNKKPGKKNTKRN